MPFDSTLTEYFRKRDIKEFENNNDHLDSRFWFVGGREADKPGVVPLGGVLRRAGIPRRANAGKALAADRPFSWILRGVYETSVLALTARTRENRDTEGRIPPDPVFRVPSLSHSAKFML
jgi:hypothetical protein